MTGDDASLNAAVERLYWIVEDTGLNVRTRVIEAELAIIDLAAIVLPDARLDGPLG